jgi:acetylornithine deacetylase or succinyl-diaminopimelate desuccinylase
MDYSLTEPEKEQAKQLLLKVLSIPTVNSRDNEGELAAFLARYFRDAGIPAEVQHIDGKHGNVIARIGGNRPDRTVVFNGHLDTVPYGDSAVWNTDPAEPVQRGGCVFARGASDMKSGLAAMVFALAALVKRGKKPNCSVLFLGTCDEEKSGLGAQHILQDGLFGEPEAMLIGEPTGNRLGVAQKGCLWLSLTVKGRTSHGSYPWEGINSVENAFLISTEIKQHMGNFSDPLLGSSTAAVTRISGGAALNMVPDFCEIFLDIRTVTVKQHEHILADIQQIVDEYCKKVPGLTAEMKILNNRRVVALEENRNILKALAQAVEQTSARRPEEIGINFFTDASILTQQMPRLPVVLFGPGDPSMAHKPNEFVEIEKYDQAISSILAFLETY